MFKVAEVAEKLNVSVSTVYLLIERKLLGHHCVGTRKGIRVSAEHLAEYLEACKRGRRPEPNDLRHNPQTFTHLDGDRLSKAWRRQGVRVE
jgi:excisionase family DNA binding protein